jgi:hypothetical protein
MTKSEVKMLIEMSDPDCVYTMLMDLGKESLAEWVADTYF